MLKRFFWINLLFTFLFLISPVSAFHVACSNEVNDATQFPFLNGTRALTGIWDMGGFNVTHLLDPVSPQDAATKNYVDTHGGSNYNATYDAKPSSTYNSTYDAKPSSTYNATYDAKSNYNSSYITSTYNATYDSKPSSTYNATYDAKSNYNASYITSTYNATYDAKSNYNASYITSTFNITYDSKPSSTYNATYDSKPSSTYNATYDAKWGGSNYNASYLTSTYNSTYDAKTNYNASYVTTTNSSYVLTNNGSYVLTSNTSYPVLVGEKIPTAQLGSGTANAGKVLAGDQSWQPQLRVLRLTANQTINSGAATFVDVNNLSFPVTNGQMYAFHYYVAFSSAQATTGWKMGVNAPTGPLDFWAGSDNIANAAAGAATHLERHNVVRDDMTLLATTVTANVRLANRIDGIYECTQDGTFAVRFANELASDTNLTVLNGSYGWYF